MITKSHYTSIHYCTSFHVCIHPSINERPYQSTWTDRRCQRRRRCGVEPPYASSLCRRWPHPCHTQGATCRGLAVVTSFTSTRSLCKISAFTLVTWFEFKKGALESKSNLGCVTCNGRKPNKSLMSLLKTRSYIFQAKYLSWKCMTECLKCERLYVGVGVIHKVKVVKL